MSSTITNFEPTAARVIEAIREGRAEWDSTLARVPRERMTEPGVEGSWSVKDIIAHNLWNEREMLNLVRNHALLPSDSDRLWMMSNDDRNARLYEMYRDADLDELLEQDREVHGQLMAAIETLNDEDMVDPTRYPNMPPDWEPWRIIAGCTFRHYPEHIAPIRAWLEAGAQQQDS